MLQKQAHIIEPMLPCQAGEPTSVVNLPVLIRESAPVNQP